LDRSVDVLFERGRGREIYIVYTYTYDLGLGEAVVDIDKDVMEGVFGLVEVLIDVLEEEVSVDDKDTVGFDAH